MTKKLFKSMLVCLMCLALLIPAFAEEEIWASQRYEEEVTITQGMRLQAGYVYPDGDTIDDNAWTRLWKERYNLNVVNSWDAMDSDYFDKIGLDIISGDLPDVFCCTPTQLVELVKNDRIADLTTVFEEYASDRTKTIVAADPIGFDSGKFDGKLYGISQLHFGYISSIVQIYVRQDWLDNLGLSKPTTYDELYEVCRAFTYDDPDGNGIDDTYGFALYKKFDYLNQFFNGFHAYPNIWITKEDGSIVYGGIQPEVKPCLEFLQKMYKDGLINEEFGVADKSKMKELMESGKYGAGLYTGSFGYSIGMNAYANNPNAMFAICEIPSIDDEPVTIGFSMNGERFTVVNKNCEHPEAAILMLNSYTWMINDLTDFAYRDTFLGTYLTPGSITLNNPLADYNQAVLIAAAQDTRDTTGMDPDVLAKYEGMLMWLDDGSYEGLPYWYQCSKDGALKLCQHVMDNEEYIIDRYHNVPTETMAKQWSSLESMKMECYTKIIMGEPIETFDDFVEQWKALGGDTITEEMNEMYGE